MEFISFLHLEKQFQLRFHGSATPRNNGIVLFTNLEAGLFLAPIESSPFLDCQIFLREWKISFRAKNKTALALLQT